MNTLKRIQMKLLEVNEKTTALSFLKEVQNLEFTEILGGMDVYSYLNSRKRNKILAKTGKRLFKKHPVHKKSDSHKYTEILSQEEIDMLLIPLDNNSLHGRIIAKTHAILRSGIYYIHECFKR
jgi:hypothetical protein